MMPTLDDRNKPVDPYKTRQSIDECSGEEWDAASRAYWDRQKGLYDEDPVYSKDPKENIFSGSLFDEAEDQGDAEPVYKMLEENDRFEQIVQILGPYYALSYCHGAALDILLDLDNAHNSTSIDVAKVHLTRMARLINETQGINW